MNNPKIRFELEAEERQALEKFYLEIASIADSLARIADILEKADEEL